MQKDALVEVTIRPIPGSLLIKYDLDKYHQFYVRHMGVVEEQILQLQSAYDAGVVFKNKNGLFVFISSKDTVSKLVFCFAVQLKEQKH